MEQIYHALFGTLFPPLYALFACLCLFGTLFLTATPLVGRAENPWGMGGYIPPPQYLTSSPQ